MRKIMFIGRSEAGKTTLTQAMKGNTITYHKTQYVNHYDVIIDTPGEYLQSKNLISALAVFTAEADVIGLLMDATEPLKSKYDELGFGAGEDAKDQNRFHNI